MNSESFNQDGKTYYKMSIEDLGIRLAALLKAAIPKAILPKVHKYGSSSEQRLNQERRKYILKIDLFLDKLFGQPGLSLEEVAAIVQRQSIAFQYFLLERFFFTFDTLDQSEQLGQKDIIYVPFSLADAPLCLPFLRSMSEGHLLTGQLLPIKMKNLGSRSSARNHV